MSQLVGKREHLRRLAVARVQEDQRCLVVNEGEAPELGDVELAVRIAADDGTRHHQHASLLGLFDQLAQVRRSMSRAGAVRR